MSKAQFKKLQLSSLKPDPEGAGLLDAPQMQIYDQIIVAAMKNDDSELAAAIRELTAVPVEERYVSRLFSALGFAFGDFDSACVKLDLETLREAEWERLALLLERRAIQFCILLRTFFGEKQMQQILSEAMNHAAR